MKLSRQVDPQLPSSRIMGKLIQFAAVRKRRVELCHCCAQGGDVYRQLMRQSKCMISGDLSLIRLMQEKRLEHAPSAQFYWFLCPPPSLYLCLDSVLHAMGSTRSHRDIIIQLFVSGVLNPCNVTHFKVVYFFKKQNSAMKSANNKTMNM